MSKDKKIEIVLPDALELSFFIRKDRVFLRYTMTYHDITASQFEVIKEVTEKTYEAVGEDIVEIVVNSDKLPNEYYEISVNISTNDMGTYLHNIAEELFIQSYARMNKEDIEENARNRIEALFADLNSIEFELTQKFLHGRL